MAFKRSHIRGILQAVWNADPERNSPTQERLKNGDFEYALQAVTQGPEGRTLDRNLRDSLIDADWQEAQRRVVEGTAWDWSYDKGYDNDDDNPPPRTTFNEDYVNLILESARTFGTMSYLQNGEF